MFGPSPRCTSISLNFILRYVTISSSVQSFTTIMTESEIPWPITYTSLRRLGELCRSYMLPVKPTDLPRVRVITFFAYLPSILEKVTQRILDFEIVCSLILFSCLTKVHFRLGSEFDLDFLQIPHWPLTMCFFSSVERTSSKGSLFNISNKSRSFIFISLYFMFSSTVFIK